MKTNIKLDDKLLQKALKLSQLTDKKAVIELALQEYINQKHREDLMALRGQVQWDGDLNQMRTDTRPNSWDE